MLEIFNFPIFNVYQLVLTLVITILMWHEIEYVRILLSADVRSVTESHEMFPGDWETADCGATI